jgi:hypothetical protein
VSEQDPQDERPRDDGENRPAYGTPTSPSYGKWGSGQSDWAAPENRPEPGAPAEGAPYGSPPEYGSYPPPGPGYGQQGYGQQGYGQPGYGGYGPSPYGAGYPAPLRASGGLANAVIALAGLYTVATWVAAFVSPHAHAQVAAAVRQGRSATSVHTAFDATTSAGSLLLFVAWIVTSVWLGRARENAVALNPTGQRRSGVWVWIGWWIPIVEFWFPKQILDDTINSTFPPERRFRTSPYWFFWVLLLLTRGAGYEVSFAAKPEDVVNPALAFTLAVVTTLTLVFWVQLVRRISAVQDELAAGATARQQGPFGG